jgi:sulfhydrogenase subunit gamma (sulfur reductase)
MPDLFTATVESIIPMAEGQFFLTLVVPKEVWKEHRQPSQYIEISIPGHEPWRGTIANRTGQEFFELIVKDKGGRSHHIASLQPNDLIQISKPMGVGFPIHEFKNFNIILGCTGVAICSMRPVIQEILLARGVWGRVSLFYGEKTDLHIAFKEEQERWREAYIDVYLSASRPSAGIYWKGHVGYVQDYLMEIRPEIRNTVAFLAGHDEMVEDFTDVLMRMGMAMNMIILNT